MTKKPVSTVGLGICCLLSLGFVIWLLVGNVQSQVSTVSASQPLAPMGFTIPHAKGTMLTQQQVRNYVETHRFWVGPTISGKMFTVQTVQLMTAQQAYQERHADYLGVLLNEQVYYVVAVGPFVPMNISSPHPIKIKSVPSAYEIWDAQSGNLLEVGT